MKLVKIITVKVIFALLVFTNILNGQTEDESIQINLQGKDLSKFLIEVDGNNVKINGMSPDDAGIKMNIIRHKSGANSKTVAEYGLSFKTETAFKEIDRGTPYMGIVTTEHKDGLQIIEINSAGPARKAGLKLGDAITAIDNTTVKSHETLMKLILTKYPGDIIDIDFIRGNRALKTQMTLHKKDVSHQGNIKRQPAEELYQRPKSLGIKIREGKDGKSWRIIEVREGSAADVAGLKVNDAILEMNGTLIRSSSIIDEVMKSAPLDQPVRIKVRRIREMMNFEIR